MRTCLGLANDRFASMERFKTYLLNYLESGPDGSLNLLVDSDDEERRPQRIRRSLEATAVVEDNVVVNAVQVDLTLENTDVIDFLSHQFGSWYGWISTEKRIVLHGLSYERIWASIGNEDDDQWLKVNAIGTVLHVRDHFVFIAVHLGGTRGKPVTIYDSMGGREEFNELALKIGQLWHRFLVLKDANVDAGWNFTVKPFHEQPDGMNCEVFALVHALQFMKVVFKAAITKVGLSVVKQMREMLFQWRAEDRFQVVRPTTVQLSVSADATIAKHLDEVSDVQVDINDDESVEEEVEVIDLVNVETSEEDDIVGQTTEEESA
eukprot:augustus_masked-scaffold_26-processed-gene-4.13-mRNA-1 protein AED:1.00 eAED:1.00 QI:0/0/0/0/1/1/2/0/320